MALPSELKVTVDYISDGEDVDATVTNRPSQNLESTDNNIISYLEENPSGDFALSQTYTGLQITLGAGRYKEGDVLYQVASSPLTLTDNATNYVEINPILIAFVFNTTGFTSNYIALYEVVTVSGTVTSVTDCRAYNVRPPVFSGGYALISDPTTGNIAQSVTTSTELSYLSGAESNIQTQLDATHSEVLAANRVVITNGSGDLATSVYASTAVGQVLVDSNDTTPGYLASKLSAGTGMVFSVTNTDANEVYNLAVNGSTTGTDNTVAIRGSSGQLLGQWFSTFVNATSALQNAFEMNAVDTNALRWAFGFEGADTGVGTSSTGYNFYMTAYRNDGTLLSYNGPDALPRSYNWMVTRSTGIVDFSVSPTVAGGKYSVWNAGNDGTGSGLDADLIREQEANNYVYNFSLGGGGNGQDGNVNFTYPGTVFSDALPPSSGTIYYNNSSAPWFVTAVFDTPGVTTAAYLVFPAAGGSQILAPIWATSANTGYAFIVPAGANTTGFYIRYTGATILSWQMWSLNGTTHY